MKNRTMRIGEGKTEAFLVADPSLRNAKAPFFSWLREEGFTFGGYHGHYGCQYIHINITRKQFAYGMPGILLARPIGDQGISIADFRQIYSIYKKYDLTEENIKGLKSWASAMIRQNPKYTRNILNFYHWGWSRTDLQELLDSNLRADRMRSKNEKMAKPESMTEKEIAALAEEKNESEEWIRKMAEAGFSEAQLLYTIDIAL